MKRENDGLRRRNSRYGRLFVLPWEIGLVLFFLVPLCQSVLYSFSDVAFSGDRLEVAFVGLKHYVQLLTTDGTYTYFLIESVRSLCTSLPIIVILSLIFALILNQQFPGRMLARAVFFLPVIIASGAVMELVFAGGSGPEGTTTYTSNILDLDAVLRNLELPEKLISLFSAVMEDIFDLIWSCGVQILLFVAGLQTIPEQLYEAGRVEGITPWEQFWYITFPMMRQIVILVVFYTMVDLFPEKGSLVAGALGELQVMEYSRGSAMLWPYFAAVGLLIGLIMLIFHRFCLRKWDSP